MVVDTELIADCIRQRHQQLLSDVRASADDVVEATDGEVLSGREAVIEPLRSALETREAWQRLPTVLETATTAADITLPADPVAAPPYLALTGEGPVLRGVIDPGRMVIRMKLFIRKDQKSGHYVRRTAAPLLRVNWHDAKNGVASPN